MIAKLAHLLSKSLSKTALLGSLTVVQSTSLNQLKIL